MANGFNGNLKRSEVPLCAFIILLLTHCYSVFAILDRRVYVDEDLRKNYKIEDFLWSGSGDGENDTEMSTTEEQTTWGEHTTTVFHTTTIISTSTIFYNSSLSDVIVNSKPTTNWLNEDNCSITPSPTVRLIPSTAISPWPPPSQHPPFADVIPDQQFWLITKLKVDTINADFVPYELEEHLARLYKLAFQRHQEHHLGLQSRDSIVWNQATLRSRFVSRKRREYQDIVSVQLHNVSTDDVFNILYSVRVSGLPVLATTAAHDMKLVSDAEVVAELGYPVITKAEPYLKPELIKGSIKPGKEYLLMLISCLSAVVFVILIVFLYLLTIKKRKRGRSAKGVKKQSQKGNFLASREDQHMSAGVDNPAFAVDATVNKGTDVSEQPSAHRKKTRSNSAQTETSNKDVENFSRLPPGRPTTSNSFLSMPSVRDFPTTPLPEPLTNLLNANSPPSRRSEAERSRSKLSRHSSLEGEDPGVVGPMVWHVYRHQLEKADNVGANECSSADSEVDVGHLRKRFDRLLDDALSMYESRQPLNDYTKIDRFKTENDKQLFSFKESYIKSTQRRSQSALNIRERFHEAVKEDSEMHSRPRTSTTEPRKQISVPKIVPEVRGAWYSNTGTPSTPMRLHSRPLSAGPFHRPVVHPEFILTDSQLSMNDPAMPIISAIKRELDNIPEYRSTSSKVRPTSSSSASLHIT